MIRKDRLNHELKWYRKAMEYVNEQRADGIEEVNAKVYARKAIGECIERMGKELGGLEGGLHDLYIRIWWR